MVVLYLKNILNMSYQKNDKANKTIVLRRDFNINLRDLDIGKRVQILMLGISAVVIIGAVIIGALVIIGAK